MENLEIGCNEYGDFYFDYHRYFGKKYNAVTRCILDHHSFKVKEILERVSNNFKQYEIYPVYIYPELHKVKIYQNEEQNMFVLDEDRKLTFYYEPNESNQEFLFKLFAEFKVQKTDNEAEVCILIASMGGLSLKKIKFDSPEFKIDEHYNDDFKAEYDKVLSLVSEKQSGLALWHGLPGTGKTSALKNLMSLDLGRDFIFIPSGYAHALGEPGFNAMLLEKEGSVLIIEDAESLLKQQHERTPGISNLLNITDGIMQELFKCLVICTFNTDLKNIDKALLRGGRLKSKYEFKKLTAAKTGTEELTLSELLFGKEEEITKTIGFL